MDKQDLGYVMREAPGKGRGIYATKDFEIGDIVYKGKIEKV